MLRTVPRTPRVVALPAGSLAKMAKNYAPFSVRNSFQVGTINSNGLEVAEGQELNAMKVFFNNKPTEFRMFGSPEELWDDVQVYIDFQGNNQYFGLDPSIHYNHTLRIYHNQNKTKE
ncbi:hypothetical protein B9Z55_007356 [Caenorhabditis nigoni]|uniref:Uncharacterized protein n=1 Tax=Caenorhabditis nigoni TaxID=1611254 RepID=A0A2G5V9D5_9PELO|nr:hypothetical protein B9Z55_007356 [Caenorhabditis nigoni]